MLWVLAGCAGLVLVYIRLAPVDVARWHTAEWQARAPGDYPGEGQFLAVRTGNAEDMARLGGAAEATARTRVIAGSAAAGHVTYQTRSRWMGFPDYTSVTLRDGQLQIFGRLRFGRKDFGVNEKRILAWIEAAGLDK